MALVGALGMGNSLGCTLFAARGHRILPRLVNLKAASLPSTKRFVASAVNLKGNMHDVYVTSRCFNAPFPDDAPEGPRPAVVTRLAISEDGTQIKEHESKEMPNGALLPLVLAKSNDGKRLGVIAGKHGVVLYELGAGGEMVGEAKALPVNVEGRDAIPSPWGDWPIYVSLADTTMYVNMFLGAYVAAVPVDLEKREVVGPSSVCWAEHAGVPEKAIRVGKSEAAKALGWPDGAPEDQAHPHGNALHPSGKWLAGCDLGANSLTVYKLPIDEGTTFKPHFTLQAHLAPDSNRHHGAGPKNILFSKDGKTLFCVMENDHTAMAYKFDEQTGELEPVGSPHSCVPQAWLDSNPALQFKHFAQPSYNGAIALSPDGKHLYCSTRGHDSVAGFAVGEDGSLSPTTQATVPSGGRVAWSLSFASDTLLVVTNQYADDPSAREGGAHDADPNRLAPLGKEPGNATIFKRNPVDGSLTPTGAVWESPHCVGVLA
ncbi:6-phosphogluconolactonase [Pseudoscourfieldia marina]